MGLFHNTGSTGPGPRAPRVTDPRGHSTHNAPIFLQLEFLCYFIRGKILWFQKLNVKRRYLCVFKVHGETHASRCVSYVTRSNGAFNVSDDSLPL